MYVCMFICMYVCMYVCLYSTCVCVEINKQINAHKKR